MIGEWLAVIALLIGTLSGLRTLHRHKSFFIQFRLVDIIEGRVDARLYILTVASSAVCLYGAVVFGVWIVQFGPFDQMPLVWRLIRAGTHIMVGVVSTGFHLTINVILNSQNKSLSELSDQTSGEGDGG